MAIAEVACWAQQRYQNRAGGAIVF